MARGKDGLYKREHGILAFRYRDATGVWREKYTGTRDRREARDFRHDFLRDLKQGTLPTEIAGWRLDQAEQWWKEFRQPRIRESTQNSERYRLQHLRLILGNKRLEDITNRDLDDYATSRLAGYEFTDSTGKRRKRPGVGAHTINKEIELWGQILTKAKLWRRLEEDYRPLKTVASDIGRALTREQLRHLAEVASRRKDWEAAFYGSVLAVNTGLRGGEIKKLRIGSLDLEHRRLSIRREDAKSDASARWIELNADGTEAATRLLLRARLLKPPATAPEHYLMPKHLSRVLHGAGKGKRGYDPNQHQVYWDTAWASLTGEAGLSGFRFHDLRHTFITQMVERGVPLGLIQAMVGHISARMLRHYTHISSGAARKAVEALDVEPILTPAMTNPLPEKEERVYRA
jgi:integrase